MKHNREKAITIKNRRPYWWQKYISKVRQQRGLTYCYMLEYKMPVSSPMWKNITLRINEPSPAHFWPNARPHHKQKGVLK
jgi:hypothetical protein